jgi:hypothetical protein
MTSYERHAGRHIVRTPHPGVAAAFIYAPSCPGKPLRASIEPWLMADLRQIGLKARRLDAIAHARQT